MNCRTISLPNGLLLSVIAIATFLKIYKYERVNGNLVMLSLAGLSLIDLVQAVTVIAQDSSRALLKSVGAGR